MAEISMKHNERVHVLHIITKLEMGGAQKVCLALKSGLEQQGAWTGLISGTHGQLCEQARKMCNTILIHEMTREVSTRHIRQECVCFLNLVKEIRKIKKSYPDLIVHTHSTKAGLLGRWAALFAGVGKRVHTIHGFGFHNHQSPIIRSTIYLLELLTSFITTHFICVSSVDRERGLRIFPRFAKKNSLIRAAVDCNHFIAAHTIAPEQTIPETYTFGTCGVFRDKKNHMELFLAFEKLNTQYPQTRLEILGDGVLRPAYEQWIKDHNLQHAIHMPGWQIDVAQYMRKWHACVFSSLCEGMPCTLVEARLLSLPIITYQTGGIKDVIFHGKNGLIYNQHDWQGLAQGMIQLIEDKELYIQMQKFPDDLKDFTFDTMVNQHMHLYKSL